MKGGGVNFKKEIRRVRIQRRERRDQSADQVKGGIKGSTEDPSSEKGRQTDLYDCRDRKERGGLCV